MSENSDLSERELDILRLVATGASNKEIARELYISSNTVKVHLRNIFAKIDVASRTEAAMFAVQQGYVQTTQQENNVGIAVEQLGDERTPAGNKIRIQPLMLWSILVIVILLTSTAIYFISINIASQNETQPISSTTDFPRWEEKTRLPIAKSGVVTVAYNNQIYMVGGESEFGVTDSVERYNPDTDTWDNLTRKPTGVSDVSGALIGGKIYIPGGRLISGELTDVLEIYDPLKDQWESGKSLPLSLSSYAAAAFEGKLYIFGGWDGEKFRDDVYEYDPETDQWLGRSSMPTPRAYSGAAVSSGKIYVLGGEDLTGPLDVNEVYSPELDDGENVPWDAAVSIPDDRSGAGVVNVVDNIFVIGGRNQDGVSDPSFIYVPAGELWQSIDLPISDQWSRMGLSLVGKQLFMLGGNISDEPTDGNYAYQAIFTVAFPVIVK